MFASNFFVLFHILISLIAIAAGLMVLGGFLVGLRSRVLIALFFVTSIATSVTGVLFPFTTIMPSHVVAILSLILLGVGLYAVTRPGRIWQRIFVGTAVAALYLNVFVLLAQTFLKNPALMALAPTQSEWPFALVQVLTLATFVALGYRAVRRAAR